jgi:hypothetical protein
MGEHQNFFYSNLFIAIVTLVAGAFGLYLYHRQKYDYKRRAAKIILLEIENAQDQLQKARDKIAESTDGSLPEHLYAMPTDSWSKNKHLFVQDFKPSEWNAINDFYGTCQLFDEAIRHNDARFAEHEREISRNVHQATFKYVTKYGLRILNATTEQEKENLQRKFFQERNCVVNMLTNQDYMFIYTPGKQHQIVRGCLDKINTSLSLSEVGKKFEQLSKAKLKFF